ncbi:RNA polymerase II elongation factor Ell-like [Macrobrachium nipponense]|uniref:RNA polymerase II elongation factor Ell-like n=1 Tax=Macrobrachium nipponense TaxID=159736 RepID=UPI0030C7E888
MAGLGCGSYELSNNITQSKSYLHVKLTDSAFNAIEDYLRIKNSAASPKIAFRNHEGEIQIPCSRNNVTAHFSFSLQSILDHDGPQGSFEFIKQSGDRGLASIGPLLGKLRIQAKDDTYDNARISMEKANQKNMLKCVKEVKTNSDSPFVRQRSNYVKKPPSSKVVGLPQREPTAELHSNNRFSNSNSPHGSHSSGTLGVAPTNKPRPPPPPSNPNGKICNPDLMKKPLRERVIQLLAIKSFRKPQLIERLHTEGLKEKDKRQVTCVLNSVSQAKDNIYHLSKHLWSEVKEDWPFYSEEEREAVRRNRPQGLVNNSHSPHSTPSLSPSTNSSSAGMPSTSSQGLKRTLEETFDPTVKRVRPSRYMSSRLRKPEAKVESEKWKESKQSSSVPNHQPDTNHLTNGHHPGEEQYGMNGALSPGTNSLSNPSTSPLIQNSPRHRLNGTINSGTHSPINSLSNGLTNGHNPPHETNGHSRVGQSTPSSSPDTNGGDEGPAYLRNYTTIVSPDQRSRYKADFNREYQEYQQLHNYVERRTRMFSQLDENLRNEPLGSEGYNKLRAQIINLYNTTKSDTDFQRKQERYNYLHEKLTHIKTLVREYDQDHS